MMNRHKGLILLRILLAIIILGALPCSHIMWGEPYPGDGQKAFGMVVMFTLIGTGCGSVYFGIGTAMQYLLRHKQPHWTAASDFAAFVVLAVILVYGGITAQYTDNDKPVGVSNVSHSVVP